MRTFAACFSLVALLAGAESAGPAALDAYSYRFTSEVRAAHLAAAKTEALAAIEAAGGRLPKDFLDWVDGDPVVAGTIYGIATNPAQRLVMLRSLELDLGPADVRIHYPQLALGLVDAYAGGVDLATLSSTNLAISLRERDLLKLEIRRYPCERVDTRPKDRPFDLNDHIINFLEDHPVVTTGKVVSTADGRKVETVTTNSRPLYAYEVYSSPERLKSFNAYMTERGFPTALDCGDGRIIPGHWGGGRDITKAYRMFRAAYEEKGLLPRQRDPTPTPAEKAAYLIRNDRFRFPAEIKRNWPRFPLNAPWPVLDYLVRSGESLREREYVWKRFCDTGSVPGYGSYIGQIAQYPDLVKARRLQPFDFAYDTYPMRLKDGGVCGTMSNIGRMSCLGLGVPATQASQPAHSCFVSVGGSVEKGFGLGIGQSIAGAGSTSVSGRGNYLAEAAKYYEINYGLTNWLDVRMVLQLLAKLPAATTKEQRLALLESGLERNPYNLQTVTSIQALLETPAQQIGFWKKLESTLAAVERPGCPKTGYFNSVVQAGLDRRLAALPIPGDPAGRELVAEYLKDRTDTLWLRYHAGTNGLDGVLQQLAGQLRAGVAGSRNPQDADRLAKRIALVGGQVKKPEERRAWADGLLAALEGHEQYASGTGRATRVYTDPCVLVLRELSGSTPGSRAAFAEALKRSMGEARTTASCTLLRDRLNVLFKHTDRQTRPAFANELIGIINGNEGYAPNPAKPAALALDPCAAVIYAMGGDLAPVQARIAEDLKRSVAGARTPESCAILSARLAAVARYAGNPEQKKSWGEELLTIIAGHESYRVKDGETADPCAVQVYQLAGRKTPAQLKAEEARLAAEEAKRRAAHPLTVAERARQDLSAPEAARTQEPTP